MKSSDPNKNVLFETTSVPAALAVMAIPTIVSQLITLIYNLADTWFIGQTNNPYMVAASSLVLTIFLMTTALANLFGFLSFHMVHFMQAIGRGKESFYLAAIRQLLLNIPLLFLLNRFFGMTGIVWTQMSADILNVIASYILYFRLRSDIEKTGI